MRLTAAVLAVATLGLAACSTTGSLQYAPPAAAVQPGPPTAVSAGFGRTARNRRDEAMGACNHQAHMARRPA